MKREDIKINKSHAIRSSAWEGIKSVVKRVPVWGDLIVSLEAYEHAVREQMREQFLNYLEGKINKVTSEYKEKLQLYFTEEKGITVCHKIIESALNAEYKDKQEIFVNALLNGAKTDVSEDEKLRFIDLIRYLSRVALNVLSVVYKIYDRELDESSKTGQITIGKIVTEADKMFGYAPELTESALRELRNIGLFSNILGWHKANNYIHEGSHISEGSFAYTNYTRRFIEFIQEESARKF